MRKTERFASGIEAQVILMERGGTSIAVIDRRLVWEFRGDISQKEPEMRKENGFSMIELLIVVTIITLIAAIAIPNLAQGSSVCQ